MVEDVSIENIIDLLQFLMLSVKIKVLILEPAITVSCTVARSTIELETKVHPKVRNHGEGPY